MTTVPTTLGGTRDLRADLARLPLAVKVRLLTGRTAWRLFPLPEIGMRPIGFSDGPIGVRGADSQTSPSAQAPSPSAMAATWDESALTRLGVLMAGEARRKGVDVVLAPVVNLQRSPIGGRHFECYSEDPLLTGRMGSAFIRALQGAGVGASVKHFVGNEVETERTRYLTVLDERTLREVYLAPFERAVREANSWTVMAAYNGLDGAGGSAPATEHAGLLRGILREEWGYDGVVVSDWMAATTTVETAMGGLDLVMPGPDGPWGDALLAAVRDGSVPEAVIDEKVERLLLLGERVGAFASASGGGEDDPAAGPAPDSPEVRSTLRELAARSIVVLRNEGHLLPLRRTELTRVALIGASALDPFVQGGGSAYVHAPLLALPADELGRALGDVELTVHRGGDIHRHEPLADRAVLTTSDGAAGVALTMFDANGALLESRRAADCDDAPIRRLPDAARTVRAETTVLLTAAGDHRIEVAPVGAHRVWIDGELISESAERVGAEVVLNSSHNHPVGTVRTITVTEPRRVPVVVEAQVVDAEGFGRFAKIELRHATPGPSIDDEIEDAVRAAAAADVAVVVVGTTPETESEGWDRPDLDLPGRQNELVRRVVAANPRTVVIVNAGAPVELPWLDEVPAVLWSWLLGQEVGGALADVLLGATEPSGRLPWTLPRRHADSPVPFGLPVNGRIRYDEGVLVGHRGWDAAGLEPAREFGFGLGYTEYSYDELTLSQEDDGIVARVRLTNTGARDGREVVQLYLEPPAGSPNGPDGRPVRWLAGFAVVDLATGATGSVAIDIERRAFEIWDTGSGAWTLPTGQYRVRAGRSSRDLRLAASLDVDGAGRGTPSQHHH